MNKMMFMGTDVYEASEEFVSDGIAYSAETWVIPNGSTVCILCENNV